MLFSWLPKSLFGVVETVTKCIFQEKDLWTEYDAYIDKELAKELALQDQSTSTGRKRARPDYYADDPQPRSRARGPQTPDVEFVMQTAPKKSRRRRGAQTVTGGMAARTRALRAHERKKWNRLKKKQAG